MQPTYLHIALLLQCILIVQARLIVSQSELFDFTLTRDVQIAQLWTYNDALITSNITGNFSWYEHEFGDCTDKILMVGSYSYFNIDDFMTCGAKAVVFMTSFRDVGLLGAQMKWLAVRNGYTTPTFQMSYSANEGWKVLKEEMAEGRVVQVVITPFGNENQWEEIQGEEWNVVHVMQWVIFVYMVITVLISVEKIVFTLLARRHKTGNNLVLMILVAEFVANAFRALYMGVDPVAARGVFSVQFSFYALQVTAPISSLTTSLLILYWFDALSHSSIFSRFKTVIFVILGILFIFGVIVLPLLFVFAINFYVLYVMLLFYFLVSVSLAIYIFYSTPSMYRIINKMKVNKQQSYTWQARMIVVSGIMLLLWCLSTFGILLFARTITGYFASSFTWLALLTSVSLAQILVFTPEMSYFRETSKASNTGSKATKKTRTQD